MLLMLQTHRLAGILAVCCAWTVAFAEPNTNDLRISTNDLIRTAMFHHLQFGDRPNQAEVERLFLEFIAENPESPLLPIIYSELGYNFTGFVSPQATDNGAVYDSVKAARYFRRSVETIPEGKVSILEIQSRVNFASLAPTPDEAFRRYIAVQEWLDSLRPEKLRKELWIRDEWMQAIREGRFNAEESVAGASRHIRETSDTMMINMKDLASRIPSQDLRIAVLSEASEKTPSSAIGQWARGELALLGIGAESLSTSATMITPASAPATTQGRVDTARELQEPPAAQMDPKRPGILLVAVVIGGLAGVLGIILFSFLRRSGASR